MYVQAQHSCVVFFFCIFEKHYLVPGLRRKSSVLGSSVEGILHHSNWGIKKFYFPNFFVFPRFVLRNLFLSLPEVFRMFKRAVNLDYSFTPPHIQLVWPLYMRTRGTQPTPPKYSLVRYKKKSPLEFIHQWISNSSTLPIVWIDLFWCILAVRWSAFSWSR